MPIMTKRQIVEANKICNRIYKQVGAVPIDLMKESYPAKDLSQIALLLLPDVLNALDNNSVATLIIIGVGRAPFTGTLSDGTLFIIIPGPWTYLQRYQSQLRIEINQLISKRLVLCKNYALWDGVKHAIRPMENLIDLDGHNGDVSRSMGFLFNTPWMLEIYGGGLMQMYDNASNEYAKELGVEAARRAYSPIFRCVASAYDALVKTDGPLAVPFSNQSQFFK